MIPLDMIYKMDCLEGMKLLDDNSVDLILTDPPYGINFESNHRKGKWNNDWDINFKLKPYFDEMMRVLSNNGIIYCFGRWDTELPLKPSGCLIWDKMDYGMGDLNFWSMSYEFIYIYKKGRCNFKFTKRPTGLLRFYKLQNFGSSEVRPTGDERQDFMKHPTQKPVELIRYILKFHNFNVCLDPFIGSGTTAVACKQLNKRFIGFEINEEFCDIARKRLMQTNLLEVFKNV